MKVSVIKCDLCGCEIGKDSPRAVLPLQASFSLKNDGYCKGTILFDLPPDADIHLVCAEKLLKTVFSSKIEITSETVSYPAERK